MKLGIVDKSVQVHDETKKFKRVRRLGYDGVEVIVTHEQLSGSERLAELQQLVAETDLLVSSLMYLENNDGGLVSSEPAVVSKAKADLVTAAKWAQELGCDVILVPFFFAADIVDEEKRNLAVEGLREVCTAAAQLGVTICFEGTLPARDVQALAEQVNSPAFGCYFDLANAVWRGMDSATEIRQLGDLIKQVHVKDILASPGDCRLGSGLVNFAESAKALDEIGFDGWLVLETTPSLPELSGRDASFTRRHFPSLGTRLSWPRLGVMSYDLPYERGKLIDFIRLMQELKMEAVQIGGDLLLHALESEAQAEEIGTTFEAHNIVVAGIAGYRNLTAPNPEKRRENVDFINRCLQIAPFLATSVVATETGTLHPDSDWTAVPENWGDEAWAQLYEALDRLAETAQKSGSILTLEGYVNNILATYNQLIGVIERYNTQHVQPILDPYNYISSHLLPEQDRLTQDFLHRFEDRFVLAHLKDVDANGAEVNTPEFGEGVFNHVHYLEFLRDYRPDLPMIFEHLPYSHLSRAKQRVYNLLNIQAHEGA